MAGASDSERLLGQVLTSISLLREDFYRVRQEFMDRLADGETRMDRQDIQLATQAEQIKGLRRELARAPQASGEPANSWMTLASAFSAVAQEWGETIRLWGRILRWLMLAYIAFSLNNGDYVGTVKGILMHDMDRRAE